MPEQAPAPHIAVTYDGDTYWLACFAAKPDSDLGDTIHPIDAGDTWDTLAAKARAHLLNCPVAPIPRSEARKQAYAAAKAVFDRTLHLYSPNMVFVEQAVDTALTEVLVQAGQLHELLDRIGDLAYRANPNDPGAAAAALSQIHRMAKEAAR